MPNLDLSLCSIIDRPPDCSPNVVITNLWLDSCIKNHFWSSSQSLYCLKSSTILSWERYFSGNLIFWLLDKQKEEALILILKRKAELLRDIARVKKDVDENQKEIAFFEDPIAYENERQATKQKELKKAIQKFNRSPKKGLQLLIDNKQVSDSAKSIVSFLLTQKGLSKTAIGELLGEPGKKWPL